MTRRQQVHVRRELLAQARVYARQGLHGLSRAYRRAARVERERMYTVVHIHVREG